MTTVSVPAGELRRSLSPDMFDDILTAAGMPVEVPEMGASGAMFTVTFAAELTPGMVRAIRDRLTSASPNREQQRQQVRADRDALAADNPLRRLYDYVLGD